MTRVDFYILQDMTEDASARFACRLGLKALQRGTAVHVHVTDADSAQRVDDLMWDYPKHRFIPHVVTNGSSPARGRQCPIQIGSEEPHLKEGLLINLAQEVPGFFGRFDRVAEIVVDATRKQGRERWAFYRDRGYPLHHHELDEWEA